MPKIIQEKFQVTLPQNRSDESSGWASEASARDKKGSSGGKVKNRMPPGTNVDNQALSDHNRLPFSMAGETDVSHDTNQGALEKGYTKKALLMTDDEYSRAHDDSFYDDVGGFVERNNMLDRL